MYTEICQQVREKFKNRAITPEEFIDAVEGMVQEIMSRSWELGYKDRGMGHGDFAVLDSETGIVVLECDSRELAEYVIRIHNKSLLEA